MTTAAFQNDWSIWVLMHVPSMVFIFLFGACMGSFLNVVIYRLPAGMSIVRPPSRCPTCGAKLRFFRENLPILGWFLLRGRCRFCGDRISPQYMIIETITALLMIGLYLAYFGFSPSTVWPGQVGGVWWHVNGFYRAWPAFMAVAFLVGGLLAMTVIDARTFTIPIEIPTFITIAAFIFHPLQSLLPHRSPATQSWPIPGVDWQWFAVAALGMLGILLGLALLKSGRLRPSFADYDDFVKEDDVLAECYPHARREMAIELLFLLPCIVGLIGGWLLGLALPTSPPPEFLQAIGGSFLGFLVGGGVIWSIRILGTLGFRKEAVGMGDVHLMAAVGAVLGWFEPILVPFLAAFSGLGWAVLSRGLGSLFRGMRRELPFGPHLAVGTVVLILCRPALDWAWRGYCPPNLPMPRPGLVTAEPRPAPRRRPLAPPVRPPSAASSAPAPAPASPPAGRIHPKSLS